MIPSAIEDLIRAGWTEARIAERVGTSQPTINRVRRGKQKPSFDIGDGIRALHREVVPAKTDDAPTVSSDSARAAPLPTIPADLAGATTE